MGSSYNEPGVRLLRDGDTIEQQPASGEEAPELLSINRLTIGFTDRSASRQLVRNVSLSIRQGEMLALIGQSGSGKSLTAAAIGGMLQSPLRAVGQLRFKDRVFDNLDGVRRKHLRGKEIGWVFQNYRGSFTPFHRIGDQLLEVVHTHARIPKKEAKKRIFRWLERVGLSPQQTYESYSFELSGGQLQRIALAAALIPEPSLLIADEPTTALDVVTGEHIMDLIADLRTETGCGVLFITHDLRHVWRRADRLAVMKEGVIVDSGTALELRDSPVHPYTRELLDASYRLTGKPTYLPEAASLSEPATEYLKAVGLSKQYGGAAATESAVDRVSLRISEGECIGLVGESGCGKSTLARLLLALEQPEHGAVLFREQALAGAGKQALRQFRRHVQVVFQDSASSLNDRLPIWRSVLEPLDNYKDAQPVFFEGLQLSRREKALRLLRITGLDEEHMDRYPHELSGGQRQRACISRGISLCPQLLICDEPTSSLDMPTQRQILNLLKRLQRELGMSLLFISHDLAAVGQLCDRLLVMKEGKIVDEFAATELWSEKRHPYTRLLISAAL